MYLKSLTLQGFKSFVDRTNFDFSGGLTAIVGPNGCGKSNLVDALKWIFGEQSAKDLRGQEMQDVIFAGTEIRRPVGFAEVMVVFDNVDRSLPTDHPEVSITRRLFRSGESDYRINGNKCRLKDIRDVFAGTGVGTESYSILEQGKIDLLLQASPRERRLIFEEAAGISRFRIRREEALRQLARTEDNLSRLNDIVSEIERRIRGVRVQAGRARRFREIEAELRQCRLRLAWQDLARLHEERSEWTFRLFLVTRRISRTEEERERLAGEAERCRTARSAVEQATGVLHARLESVRAHQHSLMETIDVTGKRIDDLSQARARWEREASDVRQYLAQYEQEAAGIAQECAQAEASEQAVGRAIEASQERLAEAVNALRDGEEALARERRALVQALEDLTRTRNDHARAEAEERLAEARRDRLLAEEERIGHSAALAMAEEGKARGRLAAVSADHQTLLEERAELKTAEAAEEAVLEERERQWADAKARIQALGSRRDILRRLLADLEGVNEAARKVVYAARQGELPQVQGLVAELLTASPAYARAIEGALGVWSQAIVVATAVDLEAVRAYLGPEAAFAAIVLETLSRPGGEEEGALVWAALNRESEAAEAGEAGNGREVGESTAGAPVAAEAASEDGDAAFRDSQMSAGQGVYCGEEGPPPGGDAQPGALLAAPERQRLLLAGPPVNMGELPSNEPAAGEDANAAEFGEDLAAGSIAPFGEGLRRGSMPRLPGFPCRWASEVVQHAESLAPVVNAILGGTVVVDDEVWASLAGANDSGLRVVSTSGAVLEPWGGIRWGTPTGVLVRRTELGQCEEELAWLEETEEHLAEDIGVRKAHLAQLKDRISGLARRETGLLGRGQALEELLKQIDCRRADLALQEDVIGREKCSLLQEFEAIQARRAELARALSEHERDRIDREAAVAGAEEALAARQEDRRAREAAIAELKVTEAAAREGTRRLRDAHERLVGLLADRRRHLQEAEQEEARAAELRREAEASLGNLRATLEARREEEQRLGEEIEGTRARLEAASAAADGAERALADLEAALAERRGELSEIQLEEREVAVNAENVVRGVQEEYQIDLCAVARGEAACEELAGPASPDENLRERVADLKDKLGKHGNVNLAAIDELAELEQRFSYLATQRDDLVKARARLGNVINDLNRKSRRLFSETFQAVNQAFGELFRKAFGGGKAELVLEEGEDILTAGIEIIARPPGKKPSHVRLLSGGERTLTTLVLLFAVLRVRPTPFVVLDEVDAPLDEANVRRFLVLLDEFIGKTQFLLITHNKLTMVRSSSLIGVTMEEKGVSKRIAINLRDVTSELEQSQAN